MNESRVEGIYYIGWHYQPDHRAGKHVTFYSSGFIELGSRLNQDPIPLPVGWYLIDDRAALQTLFDLAKEAVRSRSAPEKERDPDKPLWVCVRTTEGFYFFEDDILKLKDATLPACHPFKFDDDGHSEKWSAMKTSAVIDHELRR